MIDFHNAIVSVLARTSSGFVLQGQTQEIDWIQNSEKLYICLNLPNGNSVGRLIERKHVWLMGLQNECASCRIRVDTTVSCSGNISCHLCGLIVHKACLLKAKESKDSSLNHLISLDISGFCMKCLHMKCFTNCSYRGVSPKLARFYQSLAAQQVHRNLNWDSLHRRNQENVYCYCQGPGVFSFHMLQCANCEQWFHELCVVEMASNYRSFLKKLGESVYLKRRSQVPAQHVMIPWDFCWFFLCRLCNRGVEFLWKIQLNLVEALHLALQNVGREFVHIDHDILPWLRSFWTRLRLQVKMPWKEVEKSILSVLMQNPARFQCQLEVDVQSSDNSVNQTSLENSDEKYLMWRLRSSKGGMHRPKLKIESIMNLPLKYNITTTKLCCRVSDKPSDCITLSSEVKSFPERDVYDLVRYSQPFDDAKKEFLQSCFFSESPDQQLEGQVLSIENEESESTPPEAELPIPGIQYECSSSKVSPPVVPVVIQPEITKPKDSVQSNANSTSTSSICIPPDPVVIPEEMSSQSSPNITTQREKSTGPVQCSELTTRDTTSVNPSVIVETAEEEFKESDCSSSGTLPPRLSHSKDALDWMTNSDNAESILRKSFQYSWERDASQQLLKNVNSWLNGQQRESKSIAPRNSAVKKLASMGIRTGYEYLSNVAAAELSMARIVARRKPDSACKRKCENNASQDDNNNSKKSLTKTGIGSRKRSRISEAISKTKSVGSVTSSDTENWESLVLWRLPSSQL